MSLLFLSFLALSLAFDEIPSDAKNVLIFGPNSHNDYDWLNVFTTNVNNTPSDFTGFYWNDNIHAAQQWSDTLFSQALDILKLNKNYVYSAESISFLRAFSESNPSKFQFLIADKARFRLVGGGVTSPDDLLSSGESFIRNYLVGKLWLDRWNIPWVNTYWLPDNFGHDSQLPVVLNALGAKGVAFARIPGSCGEQGNPDLTGAPSAHDILLDGKSGSGNGGINFYWKASDGSNVLSYYMPTHYCPADVLNGITIPSFDPSTLADNRKCRVGSRPRGNMDHIHAFANIRSPISETPYLFVATGCDFAPPFDVQKICDDWNRQQYNTTKIFATTLSFDNYVDKMLAWLAQNPRTTLRTRSFHGPSLDTRFKPTPHWMGFYASRPALKKYHYDTTQQLLNVEFLNAFSKLVFNTENVQSRIEGLWELLVPSTHHDYITGTATDYVVQVEQMPQMKNAQSKTNQLHATLQSNLLNKMTIPNSNGPQKIIVLNELGFARDSLVVLNNLSSTSNHHFSSTQKLNTLSATGESQYMALVSSVGLGYSIAAAKTLNKHPHYHPVSVHRSEHLDGESFTLQNQFLSVEVSSTSFWMLTNLYDKILRKSVMTASSLEFRTDMGSIYRFGYESSCGFKLAKPTFQALTGKIIESGQLYVHFQGNISVVLNGNPQLYIVDYELHINEPFVRVSITGAAPSYTTIMAKLQFNEAIKHYYHGTPYHWDIKQPSPYGFEDTFKVTMEATHKFMIPVGKQSNGTLAAIYHSSVPSWGVLANALYGVLLRNTESDCSNQGAQSADRGTHKIQYAIRVPGTNALHPIGGVPLRESLSFATPLTAFSTNRQIAQNLPANYSLLSISKDDSSNSLISVVKMGSFRANSLIVRVYNPSNRGAAITLSASSLTIRNAGLSNALETPLSNVSSSQGDVHFRANLALSTVEIKDYSTHQLDLQSSGAREKRAEEFGEQAGTPAPTKSPTKSPTRNITKAPTSAPTVPTHSPTPAPTEVPVTLEPTAPTEQPTTDVPTDATPAPSAVPTSNETHVPTATHRPTNTPTEPTVAPSEAPTAPSSPLSPSSIVILVFVLLLFLILVVGGVIWLRRKKNPWLMNFLNPSKQHAYEEISGSGPEKRSSHSYGYTESDSEISKI